MRAAFFFFFFHDFAKESQVPNSASDVSFRAWGSLGNEISGSGCLVGVYGGWGLQWDIGGMARDHMTE